MISTPSPVICDTSATSGSTGIERSSSWLRRLWLRRTSSSHSRSTGVAFGLPRTHRVLPFFEQQQVPLSRLLAQLRIAAVPHGFPSCFRDWASARTAHPRAVVEGCARAPRPQPDGKAHASSGLFHRRLQPMNHWMQHLDPESGRVAAAAGGDRFTHDVIGSTASSAAASRRDSLTVSGRQPVRRVPDFGHRRRARRHSHTCSTGDGAARRRLQFRSPRTVLPLPARTSRLRFRFPVTRRGAGSKTVAPFAAHSSSFVETVASETSAATRPGDVLLGVREPALA